MNEREYFQKAFSPLRASDDTLQEVIDRVNGGKGAKGVSKRFVVLAAVLVMIFGLAMVAHATGLLAELAAILSPAEDPGQVIDQAFGDEISTEKPRMEDAYGNLIEAPSMERPTVDMTEVEKLIGAYISDVDGVVSIGENIFTLKSFLIDETGSGALTWTLENPEGIAYRDVGYGMVTFGSEAAIDNPTMYHYGADGSQKDVLDVYTALISKNEDGTKLELASYFGTVAKYQIGDSLVWMASRNRKQETQRIRITPAEHIPAKTLTSAEGMKLMLSNQSLTIDADSDVDFITDRVVINFKDGTQYCMWDDEAKIYNQSGAYWRNTETYRYDDLVFLFNRIIDTNAVSSVEVTAGFVLLEIVGGYYEPVRHPQNYIFYP